MIIINAIRQIFLLGVLLLFISGFMSIVNTATKPFPYEQKIIDAQKDKPIAQIVQPDKKEISIKNEIVKTAFKFNPFFMGE